MTYTMSAEIAKLKAVCKNIPLHALNMGVRNKLAMFLDPEGFVTDNYCNDWTGLAEVIGFDYKDIKRFEKQRKPTLEVLYEWGMSRMLEPSVDKLIDHICTIGREHDVISECKRLIENDVERYKRCHEDLSKPVQLNDVTSPGDTLQTKDGIYTIHDDNDTKMYYDAFVIYNPVGNDLLFVKQLAEVLEGPDYNFKLFIPYRDDLPGAPRYEVSAELIANRCRRAIVILSSTFLHSAAADFQMKFAQCLSPGGRSKRIVPVVIERCEIPDILKILAIVDFTIPGLRDWSWPRIGSTLKSPINPNPKEYLSPEELKNIKLNVNDAANINSWWGTIIATLPFPDS